MKSRYQPETNALDVRFADAAVAESEEIRPGIVLDYDAEGCVVAVEINDASEHLSMGAGLRSLTAAQGKGGVEDALYLYFGRHSTHRTSA